MRRKALSILLILSLIFTLGATSAYAEGTQEERKPVTDNVKTVDETKKETAKKPMTVKTPRKVKARALGTSSIKISWAKVQGAKGYKVYCYSKKKNKYVRIATVKKVAYVHKRLPSSTRKAYKVRAYAYNEKGKQVLSKASSRVRAKTHVDKAKKIMNTAKSKLGCSYSSGAQGPNSFDCSGYVYYIYKKAGVSKKKVIRSSAQGQYASLKRYNVGKKVSNAKKGDIVFFSYTGSTSGINHVGIYAGNGKVIHAGSYSSGVCYGDINILSRFDRKVCAIVRLV